MFSVVKMEKGHTVLIRAVILLNIASSMAYVEDLDDTFKESRMEEVWLVKFYAPWCGYCKKMEPVWHEIGSELKSSGSLINVGRMDATAYSSAASEFGVRGYPTIKLIKGDLAYNYRGPRTKDDIIEFANRVAGPAVRSLPSQEMFEEVLSHHDVVFVYIGGESPLKEKYIEVASELIVYSYFFMASEDILPKAVTLQEIPTVAVFKDGAYFLYDEYRDGDLTAWVNRERFVGYLQIDGFTLYELGETGKLVAIAIVDEKAPSEEGTSFKSMIHRLATEYRDHYSRDFQFGHMDGNDYINSLIMGEVAVPSIIVLNTSNDQYFLPGGPVDTIEQLIVFINSVLDGSAQAQGGDGLFQRVKRIAYDARSTVMSVFRSSPLLGCFLFGLPLGVISLMCYGMCVAESDDGSEDAQLLHREMLAERRASEAEEDERDGAAEGHGDAAELEVSGGEDDFLGEEDDDELEDEDEPHEAKSSLDKKVD